jgi:hypothetical protein
MLKKNILGVVCISVFAPATAFSITVPNCKKNQFSDFANLTHKISVIENDTRELFPDYARRKNLKIAEVDSRFNATGIVYCGGQQGTGQVTGNRLTITSARHLFFDDNCKPYPGDNCFFALRNDRVEILRIPIDKAGLRTGECFNDNEDWAIATLKIAVPKEINPYSIAKETIVAEPGVNLTQVSGYSDNFHPEKGKPRYITECKVRDFGRSNGNPIESDCDAGPGASGSAQLVESTPGDFKLVAIHVGTSVDAYDGMPYNADKYFNVSIPINKAFKAALDETIQATNKRLMVSGKKPVQASSIGY